MTKEHASTDAASESDETPPAGETADSPKDVSEQPESAFELPSSPDEEERTTPHPIIGSVFTAEEIELRLKEGHIFKVGTWDPENLRASAYDLRMAEDLIIVPDASSQEPLRYDRGHRRVREVILRPGDVAFVSTMERLAMPWDIAGNLGAKFNLASCGVLMLTGLFVDPGYGLKLNDADEWVPWDDARLHFLLANVGPRDVSLQPGKTRVAAIQFFKVSEFERKDRFVRTEETDTELGFFDPHTKAGAGLEFFRNQVVELSQVRTELVDSRKEVEQVRQEVREFEQRLKGMESGSTQVLMFGIYLILATILGVSITFILSLISDLSINLSWPNGVVLVSGLVAIVSVVTVCGWVLHVRLPKPTVLTGRRSSSANNDS